MSDPVVARLPYARQWISDEDIAAVVAVLKSDYLTTGPAVDAFEHAAAVVCGSRDAVAVSNGTAALHAAVAAVEIGPGDEVIVPCMTFVATANAVVYQGGVPVFADVDPATLLIDPASVERAITPRTRAIIAVDYAGQPCDYAALRTISSRHNLTLIADAAHALGAKSGGRPVGALADVTTFSFHPVKHITTGEGGLVTTDQPEWAVRIRRFRNHGITIDAAKRERAGSFAYDVATLGFNYRLTDFQCALGLSQLRRLPAFLERRRAIAARYRTRLSGVPGVALLAERRDVEHAYHLFVVRIAQGGARGRREVFEQAGAAGIQMNVHYPPVHLHSFYRQRFGTGPGLCPVGEQAAHEILSLPMFAHMTDADVDRVVDVIGAALVR